MDVVIFIDITGVWNTKIIADVYYNMLQDPHWPVHFKVSRKKPFLKTDGWLPVTQTIVSLSFILQTISLLPEIILEDLRNNYVQNYKCILFVIIKPHYSKCSMGFSILLNIHKIMVASNFSIFFF